MSTTTDVVTPSERLTGRVKWFNNHAGYGFITVTDGDKSGSDVFVHHSALEVESQQYKYLIQGEYVEFSLVKSSGGDHEWQASNVNGIKGGKLMCETRREFKMTRSSYKGNESDNQESPVSREPREARVPRSRGEGPREASVKREVGVKGELCEDGKKEWTLVKQKAPAKARGRPPRQNSEAK
jgi:CspA family cold shock protein